jgi:hypothetical protein
MKNGIQSRRMSNPNLEGVNITAKFGYQINTFVHFSQSMIKEDHPRKRSEPSNDIESKVAWDENRSAEY